jgi:hypothetical protein
MVDTIIAIPLFGFANRLKFLASIEIMAKKLKIKYIHVLWKNCDDCGINYEDVFKRIPGIENISQLPPKDDMTFYGQIHLKDVYNYILTDKSLKDTILITGGHENMPHDMKEHIFLKNKSKFYKSIVWNNDIQNKLLMFNDFPKIGIHYRHPIKASDSQDINENSLSNFSVNSPFSEFDKYIKKFKGICFFTSNSIYHKKYIQEHFANKVKVIHIDDDCNRSSKQSMTNSIIEFILLSRCDIVIGTYFSSFSDEPTYFNLVPKILLLEQNIQRNDKHFIEGYHSGIKPIRFENYLISNMDVKTVLSVLF